MEPYKKDRFTEQQTPKQEALPMNTSRRPLPPEDIAAAGKFIRNIKKEAAEITGRPPEDIPFMEALEIGAEHDAEILRQLEEGGQD